jgi:hypothetical protein
MKKTPQTKKRKFINRASGFKAVENIGSKGWVDSKEIPGLMARID